MLSKGSGLEGTPDLEPDRADLDVEHPVALLDTAAATINVGGRRLACTSRI